jgi:autotransporter strand-loop-strand O-heptosyltransferase
MMKPQEEVIINFNDGPFVEIKGSIPQEYKIEFINGENGRVEHSSTIKNNMWTKCSKRWNIPWIIKINGQIVHSHNLKGKNVKVTFDSKSTGDTLAWIPQVARFAKIYECNVTVSTFHNHWFENLENYSHLTFIPPDTPGEFYAVYKLGYFRNDKGKWDEGNYHPTQPNTLPLMQIAADILNIPYEGINYGINFQPKQRPIKEKYICIGPRSTAGLKEWPAHYWEILAKELNSLGYKVVSISHEGFVAPGIINKGGMKWEDSMNYLYHADLFIGLSSGLSWMNWTLGKYTVMINNFIPNGFDFTTNITQINDHSVCNGCWADKKFTFDRGDWDWCPRHQGTPAQHICHSAIRPEHVLKRIMYVLKFRLNEKSMG